MSRCVRPSASSTHRAALSATAVTGHGLRTPPDRRAYTRQAVDGTLFAVWFAGHQLTADSHGRAPGVTVPGLAKEDYEVYAELLDNMIKTVVTAGQSDDCGAVPEFCISLYVLPLRAGESRTARSSGRFRADRKHEEGSDSQMQAGSCIRLGLAHF